MIHVVWRVECLAIPAAIATISMHHRNWESEDLRWIEDIGANAAQARPRGEAFCIELCIRARGRVVTTKIGTGVAAETALHLVLLLTPHGIAHKHTETLGGCK